MAGRLNHGDGDDIKGDQPPTTGGPVAPSRSGARTLPVHRIGLHYDPRFLGLRQVSSLVSMFDQFS